MSKYSAKQILIFILGMLTFAVGSWILSTFIFVERPSQEGIIQDWDQICFWQDQSGIYAVISPQGCFSTNCTETRSQTSTAIVDLQTQKIQLDARFVLAKTSSFPLPCAENCLGGNVQFKLDNLLPNDYEVSFGNLKIGVVNIFSGREIPRQCFENN